MRTRPNLRGRPRRSRRRGAAAAVVASTAVVAIVIGTQVGGDGTGSLPPAAPSSQTPSAPETDTPPPASSEKVWPQWDPRDVDQLPAAPDRVAPALPEVIDPPASSPLLADDPVDAAVLAVEQGDAVQVLGTDEAWRTVPLDGRYPVVSLSPDGTRLAVYYLFDNESAEHDYGVTLHELATGGTRVLEPPPGFESWDDTGWSFLDEDTLLFNSGPAAYEVVVETGETGETEQTTVPAGLSTTVDPEGSLLVSADFSEPNVLTDYAGGTPREVSMDRTGRLARIQADEDGTVLLRVAAIGRQVDGFRVVAWEPSSGELSIVSTTDLPVEAGVVFAGGLLRRV